MITSPLCPTTPEAMSHTQPRSTSTRAGDSRSKTSISFVCRQPADLHLRRHRLYLQRQRLQLVLRPHLLPRQGRRPHRERNPRQGFVLPRRRDRKVGERWSAFAKVTGDRQLLADSWFGERTRCACCVRRLRRTHRKRSRGRRPSGCATPLAEAAAMHRGAVCEGVQCGTFATANSSCGGRGRAPPKNSWLRFLAKHPWSSG